MSELDPNTVVGVFEDRRHAHIAVERLVEAGFALDDIGYVMPEGDPVVEPPPIPHGTKAGEGLAAGATIGGLVGAAVASFIPGVGPVLAGGLLAATLTGAAGGGIVGALLGLRVPEEHALEMERHFHTGKTLVTVRSGARRDEAEAILRQASEVPEITHLEPHGRRLSDNDVSPGSGSIFPGGT